jgi:hypothetical protein
LSARDYNPCAPWLPPDIGEFANAHDGAVGHWFRSRVFF